MSEERFQKKTNRTSARPSALLFYHWSAKCARSCIIIAADIVMQEVDFILLGSSTCRRRVAEGLGTAFLFLNKGIWLTSTTVSHTNKIWKNLFSCAGVIELNAQL